MNHRIARRLGLAVTLVATLAPPVSAEPAGVKPSKPTGAATSASAGVKATAPSAPPPAWLVRTGKLATGWEALEKGDFVLAESDLKGVTGADAARATLGLARLAFETGKLADADALAKKAMSLAGADVVTKYEATAWAAKSLMARGKLDDAKKLVESLRDEVKAPRARAVLVEILLRQGMRDDAKLAADTLEGDSETDDPVYKDPAMLAAVGRVSHLVRHVKFGNATFKEANRLQKKHFETNLEWADLFLDYYDVGHAKESLRDAIAVAPDHPRTHLLAAQVAVAYNFDWDGAEKELALALKGNPALTGAYFLRGSLALHDLDVKATEAAIVAGLAIDPSDLELLSLRAAERFLDDDKAGFEKAKKEVFLRDPQYSNLYTIVNEFAEWEHRYDDIVDFMKAAVIVDPDDGKAWATLGFNLLRRGEEDEGLKALDTAYKKDKYNVRLVNTLNLFEKTISKKFELFDGTGAAAAFKFRFDKEEAPLMTRYAPKMFGDAWGVMVKKYGFTPKNPVQIEVYPERENFAVRTDGLPNVGASGVCFGRVITAVSPKKEPANWGVVLWHELGHVFAIQLSKSHVPRWFTEGLSEYETIVTRPEWHRALDPELYMAMGAGRVPKIAEMNRAFTHAKSGHDVITAYYASSQMVVYIVEKYGFPKVVQMLKLWGDGKKSPDVLQTALSVSSDTLDADFRTWLKKRLARYDGQFMFDEVAAEPWAEKPGTTTHEQALHAAGLFVTGKYKDADAAAAAVLALDDKEALAHYILAKTAFGLRHDSGEAKKHALALVAAGDGYVARNMLADLAEAAKDPVEMRKQLEKAASFDPTKIDPLVDLYKLAVEEKRDDDALELLRKMVKMDPHERLPWNKLLAELAKRQLWDETIQVAEGALFVDPYSATVHATYARALTMKGKLKDANEEIDAGLDAKPKPEGEALLHVERARAAWKAKDLAKAKAEIDAALKLDPKSDDAVKLRAAM